jgi:hypothetical protein
MDENSSGPWFVRKAKSMTSEDRTRPHCIRQTFRPFWVAIGPAVGPWAQGLCSLMTYV